MTSPLSGAANMLHLLGRFDAPYTGAERELMDMARLLAGQNNVRLWSTLPVHACYAGCGLAVVRPFANEFPQHGTLLVGGVHVGLGIWLKYARLERVILAYNLASHTRLFSSIETLRALTGLEPELRFVSHALQSSVGLPGRVVHSVMDLSSFLTAGRLREASGCGPGSRPLTIGRLSRDVPEKHHPDDPALYRMLDSRGVRVRIMGGTCLAAQLRSVSGVELLQAGAEAPVDFYRSLDVFFYRTGSSFEAYGRVVVEAMASGLPVVADDRGGYAEIVKPAVTGYLTKSQEEAWDGLMALKESPWLREQLGRAGVQEALRVHGPDAAQEAMARYFGP